MSLVQTFQVFPKIPEELKFLEVLARNMWWCWNLDVIDLFRRIDPKLWDESGRNPIRFFTMISQEKIERLAEDEGFIANIDEVREKFTREVAEPAHHTAPFTMNEKEVIAYFSMEFGIHESLPLFAGGLGVLAGDYLKAASDLGLPIVGVGLFYKSGYFTQFLDHEGWQREEYPITNLYHLPIERAKDLSGNDLRVSVTGPQGPIQIDVWRINIGRIPLFLLDTNLKENPPAIREINAKLYMAIGEIRLSQEIVLGIGGIRALKAMGYTPVVCHLNEGHCSFSALERLAQIIETYKVDLDTAKEINARTTIFTTHTPVPAGYDEFPPNMVLPYLKPYEDSLGVKAEELLRLGQIGNSDPGKPFSMFVLGLHLAQDLNGVSELHGRVARRMWSHVWPNLPEDEAPITHITNGVHIPSWISIENALLFQRYLGPDWATKTWNTEEMISRIDDIYDEELWRAHEMSRTRLVRSCRRLMVKQYGRRNAPKSVMLQAESVLDNDILTIGFARRFAAYKRADLLLKDLDRLEALLGSKNRPIQIIFAGKAHPMDDSGKAIIQKIVRFASNPAHRHRVVFLENYDINIARHLVQGADVWLNTPRRPMEACGTSGMKAAANGVLNVSILDGWWCEGYSPQVGWAIGNGEEYDDYEFQDAVESQALYNVLENDVIPCFYERDASGVPGRWVSMMKASMKMAMQSFCAKRMVTNYATLYEPAVSRYYELTRDGAVLARELKEKHDRLRNNWRAISIETPQRIERGHFRIGESITVSVVAHLGALSPQEVDIEIYYGKILDVDTIVEGRTQSMAVKEELGNGAFRYESALTCETAGRFGFTVRALPKGDKFIRFTPGLITWA